MSTDYQHTTEDLRKCNVCGWTVLMLCSERACETCCIAFHFKDFLMPKPQAATEESQK